MIDSLGSVALGKVVSLDHVVIIVSDLDEAIENFRAKGVETSNANYFSRKQTSGSLIVLV